MQQLARLGAVSALLLAAACYNPGSPAGPADAAQDATPDAAGCTGDDQCPPGMVCDTLGTQTCGQCSSENQTACTGATPVCGTDQTCRSCQTNTECPSQVCLESGGCEDANTIAYVSNNGDANSACSQATPCKTLAQAIATAKPTIFLMNDLTAPQTSVPAHVKLITGAPGTNLIGPNGQAFLLFSTGAGATVTQLTIGGTATVRPQNCVYVLNNAQIEFDNVTLNNCQVGLNKAGSGKVTVTNSRIIDNDQAVTSTSGAVALTASVIARNGNGIVLASTLATLTNNFVLNNRNISSDAVGLQLTEVTGRVTYNTIVGSTGAGALCDSPAGITMVGNIIAGNALSSQGMPQQVDCLTTIGTTQNTVRTSITALKFANPASGTTSTINPDDYKLTGGSAAINLPREDVVPLTDFFSNPRPQGPAPDDGAHEF